MQTGHENHHRNVEQTNSISKHPIYGENSIFNYYKKLIKLRKEYPAVLYGKYAPFFEEYPIHAYTRTLHAQTILVIRNYSYKSAVFKLSEKVTSKDCQLLISNYPVQSAYTGTMLLKPYESRVYLLG